MRTVLVTGGAGFIGGNFIHFLMAETDCRVINLDNLTYAGNLDTLASLARNPRYCFVHGDIGNAALVAQLFADFVIDAVVNFAAESHVDRSIDGPAQFIETNVVGTFTL
ncbi:MAG TPA: GDP-mannose 4,6-dehydratase, partial [Lamprocystis sp. (in: g-proteobacteria)]|nr:GDP-mannose 4,6-dehydratase [Lamprocystis sp. (in: g-proteobacteria)]